MFGVMGYEDPGDKYDDLKWDFKEDGAKVVYRDGYPYKIGRSSSNSVVNKLEKLRHKITRLCIFLIENPQLWETRADSDGIRVFLDLHMEQPVTPQMVPEPFRKRANEYGYSSRYLLSEIPRGTVFDGLNKPKQRYMSSEPMVGKDGSLRAAYRDVFLDMRMNTKKMRNLILHELSHSGCNHVRWRDDDHNEDFQAVEELLTYVADQTGF